MKGISRLAGLLPAIVFCCGAVQARPWVAMPDGGESSGGGTAVLREGTPVQLAFVQSLSSKAAAQGAPVSFTLVSDIRIGGLTVAKAGSKVFGHTISVKRAAAPGKSGELRIQLDYLAAGNERVKLSGSRDRQGASDIQYSRPYHLKWPMGLLRTGDDVEINQGTTLTAFVAEDISLPEAP